METSNFVKEQQSNKKDHFIGAIHIWEFQSKFDKLMAAYCVDFETYTIRKQL